MCPCHSRAGYNLVFALQDAEFRKCVGRAHAALNSLAHKFFTGCLFKRQLYDLLGNLLGDDQYAVNIAEDDISVVYGHITNFDWAAELHPAQSSRS